MNGCSQYIVQNRGVGISNIGGLAYVAGSRKGRGQGEGEGEGELASQTNSGLKRRSK